MSRRVIRSDLALIDLEEQSEYIRQRSPSAALRFLKAAEAVFRQLASMPGMGERYETDNPLFQELRCFPIPKFPSHLVYYKSLRDGIIVIRVLHGARDIDGILGQDGTSEEE
jgi:toxin ParE1/3/4